MTVAELIKALEAMPQDADAWMGTGDGYVRVGSLEVAQHVQGCVMIYPDQEDM